MTTSVGVILSIQRFSIRISYPFYNVGTKKDSNNVFLTFSLSHSERGKGEGDTPSFLKQTSYFFFGASLAGAGFAGAAAAAGDQMGFSGFASFFTFSSFI
jgi:hypothetical protein